MKFTHIPLNERQDFFLIYMDYAFDREPHDNTGFSSVLINDLQLEIDDEGKVDYVWGYCPLIVYKEIDTFPTHYTARRLVAMLDEPPIPGVSTGIPSGVGEGSRWPMYINKKMGWVCLGNPEIGDGQELIEFVPGCVATLKGQELFAVWLNPVNWEDIKDTI